uniref:Uncharacterized protein n=1 Tax=Anguilla anguilla TaxID=7936 RepID=A0A0E9U9A3_ANGAN
MPCLLTLGYYRHFNCLLFQSLTTHAVAFMLNARAKHRLSQVRYKMF